MFGEEAILGTILKEPHLLVDSDLKEEYFQSRENRNILKAMKDLSSKGQAIDMITLLTKGNPEEFGGASKLNRIQNLANELKFDSYVEILMDTWREREKLNILEIAKNENWAMDKITSSLDGINEAKMDDRKTLKDSLVRRMEQPWQKTEKPKGVNTGLPSLEIALGGLQNSELTIVAARPSMGKTDFMLHLVRESGWSGCIPIIFSLEMSEELLVDRMIAATGNYNRSKMKDVYNMLTEAQKQTWGTTLGKLSTANVETFDKSGQTISEIRMKVRKVKNENPGKQVVVFIDYLTLIKPSNDHGGNNHLAVSEIAKGLKSMAKEFVCPVVVLAQLNRGVEQRQDKRPMLSDLRESGGIEEALDTCIFLYRDSYYSKNDDDKTMELIIAKNRNGAVGTVEAVYNKFTGVIS